MSDNKDTRNIQRPAGGAGMQKRRGPMGGRGHGPGGIGMPVEKAKNFKGTLIRLLKYLKPHRLNLIIVLIFAIASTAFMIVAPKIMGTAMNDLQDGYMAKMMLQEVSKAQKTADDEIDKQMADIQDKFLAQAGKMQGGKGLQQAPQTDPAALKAVQDFMALPRLDSLSTQAQKSAVIFKMLDIFDKLPDSMKQAAAGSSAVQQMTPDTLSAVRELMGLPMLDTVTDASQKADIVRKMLDLGKRMPQVQQNPGQNAQMAGVTLTPDQIEGAIANIKQTNGVIDLGKIGRIVLWLIGIYLLSSLFNMVTGLVMSGVSQRTVRDLRTEIDRKLTKLPLKYYDMHSHGDILSRVTNDIDTIAATLQQSLTQIISSVMQIIGYIVMMLTISPLLTLIVMATLPLYILTTTFIAKKAQKYFAAQQKELGDMSGHVEEMFTGHKIVKAFGREPDSIKKFGRVNDKLYDAGWKAQFVSGVMFPLMNFISNIGYVLICIVGGLWMTKNMLQIGDITAFIQYARSFTQPIVQTSNIANVIQSTIACAERVFEVIDEPEEIPDKPDARVLSRPEGEVAFDHVDFSYKDEEPLIDDMNLNVRKGHTIAIVGPTGAGKTTLVNLLMRFYEIKGGTITVDGTDIRDITRSSLRKSFGMVLQDTWLFNGTIRDNIAYGREDATMDEIVEAARVAHADHFIRTLPDGYDTVLNEEATNISQGQKQLLTIARAVLADPAMLILDEATSSVDTRTEVLIQKAMENLMKGRTSFVIAHRLSTIRDAELILVMNHGSIIEQGSHRELLEKGGFYADLYYSQFAGPGLMNGTAGAMA